MLKQQCIPVGDTDTISNAIDKQKVSFLLTQIYYNFPCEEIHFPVNFRAHQIPAKT